MNEAAFDGLVGDFYRAATGALGWDRALDGVRTAFGARVVGLQKLDLIDGRLISIDVGGPSMEEPLLAYIRDYHHIDRGVRTSCGSAPKGSTGGTMTTITWTMVSCAVAASTSTGRRPTPCGTVPPSCSS